MGCFNSSGFISKLPIKCGDRVVCFIALCNYNASFRELYYPDVLVKPYFLPVRGQYDDYGCVENIDRTHIVEIIEKYAETSIENVLNGIERCLYGRTIEDNIKYWLKDDEPDDCHKKEAEQYQRLIPLFKNLKDERFNKMMGEYIEKYKLDFKLPKLEEGPILLMEHEEIYDKITNEFFTEADSSWFRSGEEVFTDFMEYIHLLKKIFDDNKDKDKIVEGLVDIIPSPSGYYSDSLSLLHLMTVLDKETNDELMSKKKHDIYLLGSNADGLKMFDNLNVQDKFDVYEKDIDELRRFFILYRMFCLMPSYFTPSQTAGMQDYNYDLFTKVYKACNEKLEKDYKEEIGDTEDE